MIFSSIAAKVNSARSTDRLCAAISTPLAFENSAAVSSRFALAHVVAAAISSLIAPTMSACEARKSRLARKKLFCVRNNDRLPVSPGGDDSDTANVRAPGLGEDRRRVAGVAEIDPARVERLKERRTGRKLDPPNRQALRLEPALELPARFDDQKDAGLPVADPQSLRHIGNERPKRARRTCGSCVRPRGHDVHKDMNSHN